MEELFQSLLSGVDTLTGQLKSHLFEMTEPEGPVLMLVDAHGECCVNHPGRVAFLDECPDVLPTICRQIADGYDPCVYAVEDGCVIGTQLTTERADCGYFLIFLPGYRSETVQTNMDLFELLLAQVQVICQLTEKNNRLHHQRLSGLSGKSAVLA